jgi:hypothetical protein
MKTWDKKTYQIELEKGYWDLEPHFNYFCTIESMGLFETFVNNEMSIKDIKSALYGEFVCKNKPILKGFYDYMNFTTEILTAAIKKVKSEKQLRVIKNG